MSRMTAGTTGAIVAIIRNGQQEVSMGTQSTPETERFSSYINSLWQKAKVYSAPEPNDEFSNLLKEVLGGVKISLVTDDRAGKFLHAPKHIFEITATVCNKQQFTVYLVRESGVILPSKEIASKRWLICCSKAGWWDKATVEKHIMMATKDTEKFTWRNIDVTAMQKDKIKKETPAELSFKFARMAL